MDNITRIDAFTEFAASTLAEAEEHGMTIGLIEGFKIEAIEVIGEASAVHTEIVPAVDIYKNTMVSLAEIAQR
ncbi:hypothetical protein [Streptomyces sp. NPDC003952]